MRCSRPGHRASRSPLAERELHGFPEPDGGEAVLKRLREVAHGKPPVSVAPVERRAEALRGLAHEPFYVLLASEGGDGSLPFRPHVAGPEPPLGEHGARHLVPGQRPGGFDLLFGPAEFEFSLIGPRIGLGVEEDGTHDRLDDLVVVGRRGHRDP